MVASWKSFSEVEQRDIYTCNVLIKKSICLTSLASLEITGRKAYQWQNLENHVTISLKMPKNSLRDGIFLD